MKIEQVCLEVLTDIIKAAFESKQCKFTTLNKARVNIELLKKLFSFAQDLNIIPLNLYLEFETDLQEISKMTSGWIKYLTATHE